MNQSHGGFFVALRGWGVKHQCEGSCEEHIGQLKEVEVVGWGLFTYCQAAIEEDMGRKLMVVHEPTQAGRE